MKLRTPVLALVLLVSVGAAAHAQSLGDIAKKAAADKAAKAGTTAPPTRTITNKDLRTEPTAAAGDPVTVAATPATPATAPAVTGKPDTEAYWRARLAPLQDQLARDMKGADVVRGNLLAVTDRLRPNLPSLAAIGPEVTRLTTEMKTWNGVLAADLQAIENLKDEGRRAGAFPGWFR